MIKLGEVVMIFQLHRKGLSISAIAREYRPEDGSPNDCRRPGTPVYRASPSATP